LKLIANGNVARVKTDLGKIGGYRLVALLGSGGMGDVYLGVSPTADPVAVKVIRPHLVSGHQVRERFAGEVESLKLIFGSRVARLEDADPFADPAWLAVEYVPGLTLKQYVEARGPLPVDLTAMIGAMLADGLSKVHQGGLLHRDLKPQNIILGPTGPVLIDFGLAVLAEREHELTETGVPVGTPAYMAPEQARGDKEFSAATDIYGLAATLVFALTGHPPYGGAKVHVLLARIADPDNLPDLTGVPTALAPLVGAMLAYDPGARPGLATVLGRLLQVAISGGATAAHVRQRVVEATYDDTRKIEIPADLTDPVEDPQDLTGDASVVEDQVEEPDKPDETAPPILVPRMDVSWLMEKLRRQYAGRRTGRTAGDGPRRPDRGVH
jgi:serine/threonine protein kinase